MQKDCDIRKGFTTNFFGSAVSSRGIYARSLAAWKYWWDFGPQVASALDGLPILLVMIKITGPNISDRLISFLISDCGVACTYYERNRGLKNSDGNVRVEYASMILEWAEGRLCHAFTNTGELEQDNDSRDNFGDGCPQRF